MCTFPKLVECYLAHCILVKSKVDMAFPLVFIMVIAFIKKHPYRRFISHCIPKTVFFKSIPTTVRGSKEFVKGNVDKTAIADRIKLQFVAIAFLVLVSPLLHSSGKKKKTSDN